MNRFHRIAPTSPAKITTGVILASFTRPLEIVLATSTERKAPTRLSTPATATATLGRRAPVAMEVAIAFAVSWKPLVKSKINAVTMTTTTITDRSTEPPSFGYSGTLRTVGERKVNRGRLPDARRAGIEEPDPLGRNEICPIYEDCPVDLWW